MTTIVVRSLFGAAAAAPALVLDEPLSLWGGLDAATGRITDVHHPQHGERITDQIVFMATGRGSSSASSVLAEAARLGTAPAGFVLSAPDEIIVLGALVADELYGIEIPVVVADPTATSSVESGDAVAIHSATLTIG